MRRAQASDGERNAASARSCPRLRRASIKIFLRCNAMDFGAECSNSTSQGEATTERLKHALARTPTAKSTSTSRTRRSKLPQRP
ncbi:hypothetical protein D3C77_378450 [compost metagenome]